MKVSIIIAVYNSHKIVVRQLRHFKKMNLPNDVEFIIVDDGSDPPLNYENCGLRNLRIIYTNDKRPWTQGIARNIGAKEAKGEYLLMTDIDHIITKEAIEAVRNFDGDKMTFFRYFGIFDRRGNLITDADTLLQFGMHPRYIRRKLCGGMHTNTFAIKKSVFEMMKGYNKNFCEFRFHAGGKVCMSEDRDFALRWGRLDKRKKVKPDVLGPNIYFYPTGRFHVTGDNNPGGLFHSLSLEQVPQPDKGNDITFLYYTANLVPEPFAIRIREHLIGLANGIPIISISQKPIDFGKNICVGDIGVNSYNVYKQILIGAKEAKTKYVACCEDDALYNEEHFAYRPPDDVFAYDINRWNINGAGDFAYKNRPVMSMCIANRKLMIDVLETRFKKYPTVDSIGPKHGEPGRFEKLLDLPIVKLDTFSCSIPSITFNHKDGLGGVRINVKTTVQRDLDYWGNGKELWNKYYIGDSE